jgi:G6PDH family F420-dependent oxidoreductase
MVGGVAGTTGTLRLEEVQVRIGYTLMTEQSGPKELVRYATYAEDAGFDFAVMSDHYFPWLEEQGHSGYAWTMLGAIAQATDRIDLMTYVTCPIMRYHPAVVAQKAATVQILSDGRFTLGLGAGENLNEHVIGRGWPPVNVRHKMLEEAVGIIDALFDGGYVDRAGQHFRVDSAKLWDLPDRRVPIATAVSGDQSIEKFAPLSDHLVAVEPSAELVEGWRKAGPRGDRAIGQMPICWGPDRDAAVATAHEQFRWFGGGWKVNAELPGPAGFAGATQFVRPEDVAESIPCGPDLEPIVEAAAQWKDAGFTDLAFVQIGDEGQQEFVRWAEKELLPALRDS